MERIVEVEVDRRDGRELAQGGFQPPCRPGGIELLDFDDLAVLGFRFGLLEQRLLQLDDVQLCIRIAGEHTAAAGSVHGLLAALRTLGVVVAVDCRCAHLGADLVELVAECAHVAGVVLVAGDHLVDGVDDDGSELLVLHAPDQYGNQLVQRQRVPAQVPDHDVLRVRRRKAQPAVDGHESVDTGGRVDFQIHIQHLALHTAEAQPLAALGDGDRQLDEEKALARLAGASNQHLVPAPQDAANQLGRLGRRHLNVAQAHRLREQRQLLGVLQPLAPRVFADIGCDQLLHHAVAQHTGHAAQAGGVLVGVVHREAVQLQKAEQVVDPMAVFLLVGRVDAHDSVHALSGGVHQRGDGQVVFAVEALLFFLGHVVRFDEHVSVRRHIPVGLTVAVQRVHPDPCAAVSAIGADDIPDVGSVAQAVDEVRGLQSQIGIDGLELAVLVGLDLGCEAYEVIRLEQRFQIADEHLTGRKLLRLFEIGEGGDPAVHPCHGADGAHRHGTLRAFEGRPAPGTVALDVALIVP